MFQFRFTFFVFTLFVGVSLQTVAQEKPLRLWYDAPALDWQSQALPIGNGYMGAMFFGGIAKEQIQFSEATLWSGGPGSGEAYNYGIKKDAWKHLAAVRTLLKAGKMKKAHELANSQLTGSMLKSENDLSSYGNYGAQQTMGNLFVNMESKGVMTDYIRSLDIENAEGCVSFSIDGVKHKRTYFASYPARVLVYHLQSSEATNYSFEYQTPHVKLRENFANDTYTFQGAVKDNSMAYETCMQYATDGEMHFKKGKLYISNATQVAIFHTAATDYSASYPSYKGNDYKLANKEVLNSIRGKSFEDLRQTHQRDYKRLFERVTFDLGEHTKDTMATDERLLAYANNEKDLGLEALYFQYSRYLMIAASRPGTMPMHLQGKWNNSTNPAWACDYHMNINQQMLYWPVELTNLSECHEPLFDYMETLVAPGKETAKEFFNARGWTVNTMNNPFGYTAPGWKFPWGFYPAGAGWLCQHVWEHYAFTQDKDFLATTAYPLLKEASLFWMDYLIEDENGALVSSPSYSPEHGGISQGASMDHQIAWDLLNNTVAAGEILAIDVDFREAATRVKNKILTPQIGHWGQLQEWKEDVDDPKSKHRHVSHLFALHPGKQITVAQTPALASAAKVSLEARGDEGTGWSLAWKTNFWARLKDGDRAYKLFRRLLHPAVIKKGKGMGQGSGTYSNLFCAHPPFQLDGNMGGAAGMAEMLLQSHTDCIELLPALPKAWQNGDVKGLKARGNFEVELHWAKGKLTKTVITAVQQGRCTVQYGAKKYTLSLEANKSIALNADLELE